MKVQSPNINLGYYLKIVLIGRSGVGKTSLFNILTGS